MAKLKTWDVAVRYTVRRSLYAAATTVKASRPHTALAMALRDMPQAASRNAYEVHLTEVIGGAGDG